MHMSWHAGQYLTPIRYTLEPVASPAPTPRVTGYRRHRRRSYLVQKLLLWGLELFVATCLVFFVGGQGAYVTPLYRDYMRSIVEGWWDPHLEMIEPSYLMLVGVAPTLACVLALQWLRRLRSQRGLWSVAKLLRRRPWVHWLSYGELLFLSLLVGGNVAVFWYSFSGRYQRILQHRGVEDRPPDGFPYIKVIGNCLGFNCVLNLALLFLPATRNSAWMEFFDISYANGIKYHRWLGVAAVLTGFIHGACYYWCWIRDGRWQQNALPCWHCSLRERVGRHIWINVFGELALLCFILIGVTSIPWIRRKMFNLFYYVHQLLFLVVGFTVLHWASALWFLLPPFVAYIISRTLSCCNAATPAIVAQFSALSPSLCKLVLVRSPQQQGGFQVGQFVYLKVPAISKLQWHAFTIASSPRSSLGSREFPKTMTLLVKALGNWTEELVAYAQDCERRQLEPEVHVDGYYGASLGEIYPLYETVVLVGGGIGMTPLLAVLDDVCTAAETRQTRGQRALRQRIYVIFMMRELELLAEIYPLLARVRELDPFGRFFSVSISLTSAPTGKLLDRPLYPGVQSPKKRDFHPASKRSEPFAVSLGHGGRSLVHFVAFAVVVTLVLVLQYDNGRLVGDLHDSVWVVRSAIKALALFSASVCVYIGVVLTRWTREARVACNLLKTQYGTDDLNLSEKLLLPDPKRYAAADLLSYRSLVSELRVQVGEQPNLVVQLREVHSMHLRRCASKNSPISVFVSGPTSLKTATVAAVAAIDARDFDIHEEEFEL